MRTSVEFVLPRHLTRVAVVALLAGLAAGCSSDTMRFSENPFSDPFRSQPQQTASVQPAPAYPVPRVRAEPLPSVSPPSYPRPIAAQPLPPVEPVATVPAASAPRPVYGYNNPPQVARPAQPVMTGSIQSASPRISGFKGGGWSAQGGTVVTAGAGDSVYTLSNRFGVPANAIMSVNGLSAPNLTPGQRITIPVYSTANAAPAPAAAPPLAAAQPLPASHPETTRPVRTVAVAAQPQPAEEPVQPKAVRTIPLTTPPRPVAEVAPRPAEPAPAPKPAMVAQGGTHVVKPGETLTSIARAYGTTRPALARENALDEWATVRIGQSLKVSGSSAAVAAAKPAESKPVHVAAKPEAVIKPEAVVKPVQVAVAKPEPVAARKPEPAAAKPAQAAAKKPEPAKPAQVVAAKKPEPKPVQVAAAKPEPAAAKPVAAAQAQPKPAPAKPVQTAAVAAPQPEPTVTASITPVVATKPAEPVQQAAAESPAQRNAPEFRWPVRGRVIQTFGQNGDGINIAVPEGTDVKAAENGVVAYAGNELKGYGNLVLIRHADGYVTAYAHAKDLAVKRGDTVKRGQTIATAGQTGNVTSPQLLFELRRGAQPVDPRPYLAGT